MKVENFCLLFRLRAILCTKLIAPFSANLSVKNELFLKNNVDYAFLMKILSIIACYKYMLQFIFVNNGKMTSKLHAIACKFLNDAVNNK